MMPRARLAYFFCAFDVKGAMATGAPPRGHEAARAVALVLVLLVALGAVASYAYALRYASIATRRYTAVRPWAGAIDVELRVVVRANPCLVAPFRIGSYESIFVIDTGYAGAPVLNARLLHAGATGGSAEEHARAVAAVECDSQCAHDGVRAFVEAQACTDYTSGCVLRLMGIGVTSEQASDMLLCPPVELRALGAPTGACAEASPGRNGRGADAPGRGGGEAAGGSYVDPKASLGMPRADVLMTNREMTSPHILTLDYLLQFAPCLLRPSHGVMRLAMTPDQFLLQRAQSTAIAHELHGGAFVCDVRVNGKRLRCTVDTGASITLSVSRSKMIGLNLLATTHVRQQGIHAEVVCSDMTLARVEFAGRAFPEMPVFVNTTEVEGTDGYIGLGVLRAFDLLLTPRVLFAAYNGAAPSDAACYAGVLRGGACPAPTDALPP